MFFRIQARKGIPSGFDNRKTPGTLCNAVKCFTMMNHSLVMHSKFKFLRFSYPQLKWCCCNLFRKILRRSCIQRASDKFRGRRALPSYTQSNPLQSNRACNGIRQVDHRIPAKVSKANVKPGFEYYVHTSHVSKLKSCSNVLLK